MVITANVPAKSATIQFTPEEWALLLWLNQSQGVNVPEMIEEKLTNLLRQIKDSQIKELLILLQQLAKAATPAQLQQAINALTP